MSEFDRENNESTSGESVGEVEAFEDFEMTGENSDSLPDAFEASEAVEENIAEEAEAADENIAEEAEAAAEDAEVAEAAAEDAEVAEAIAEDAEDAEAIAEDAEVAEAIAEDAAEEAEAVAEDAEDAEAVDEETAEEAEAVEENIAEEAEAADETIAEEAEAIETIAEVAEAVAEDAEDAEAADENIAEEAEAAFMDADAAFMDLESAISRAGQSEAILSEGIEYDQNYELTDNRNEDEDLISASQEAEETNVVDEDDYLDYDDSPRQKIIVSGKAAVITMLLTCFVTIGLIAGAFWLGINLQRDTGISVVSYADRFNACDTNKFSLSLLFGTETVSFSDKDTTFSEADVMHLKKGETVTKFNDLVNIKAKTRFGKIVSLDITFDKGIDDLPSPAVNSLVLVGGTLSGLMDGIDSGDMAFLLSYNLVNNSTKRADKGENIYGFNTNGLSIYTDYSKIMSSKKVSDMTFHVESDNPHYIDTEKLDFSWLPFDLSSRGKDSEKTLPDKDSETTVSDKSVVSPSDKVSKTDQ